jgi:Leucine-rich repeat (LRR) protein
MTNQPRLFNFRAEQLHLGHNQISSLPDDVFGNLQTLTLLDLKNNNLKAIPETIDTLSYLSNFDISGNQIAVRFAGGGVIFWLLC